MTQQEFFNRYSFNVRSDKIGGGSFGTVYRAYDNFRDREVAIKKSEIKELGGRELSLRDEFKAIEKLPTHANIAHYEDVFTFESQHGVIDYAVMQYYKEGDLSNYLEKNKKLSLGEREAICIAILNGIAHLHKHKVVHRDLKPGNILVALNPNGQVIPKITDFGISKRITDDDARGTRFTNSFINGAGTLMYSSPEQIKGERLKLNTDLWSFGTIAFELLTGEQLFQVDGFSSASAEWQNQMNQKILKQDIKNRIQNLPEKWINVLGNCLQRNQNLRAKTADDIKDALWESKKFKSTPNPYKKESETNDKDNNAQTEVFNERPLKEETGLIPPLEKKPKPTLPLVRWFLIFVLVTILALFIYSLIPTEQELWNKAKVTDSFDDYENYLNRFPDGMWKNEAISYLFEYANQNKTIETYQKLLSKYPNKEAQIELEKLFGAKNRKEYDQLINDGKSALNRAQTHYRNKNYKKCVVAFNEAKSAFGKAEKAYDVDDANAKKMIQKLRNQVNNYISNQKQDMSLNPLQKDLYTKNINILNEILQ